jgi:Rad3-related DNA helicase
MKKLLFVAGILLASSFSFAQNAPVALPKQFVVRALLLPSMEVLKIIKAILSNLISIKDSRMLFNFSNYLIMKRY